MNWVLEFLFVFGIIQYGCNLLQLQSWFLVHYLWYGCSDLSLLFLVFQLFAEQIRDSGGNIGCLLHLENVVSVGNCKCTTFQKPHFHISKYLAK